MYWSVPLQHTTQSETYLTTKTSEFITATGDAEGVVAALHMEVGTRSGPQLQGTASVQTQGRCDGYVHQNK